MAKTDWKLTDTVKPADLNSMGQEINDLKTKSNMILSTTPPTAPYLNTYWLEDLGSTENLSAGLLIGNASTSPGSKVWFEEI